MKPIKPYRFLLLNLLSVKLAEHTLSLSYFFELYCLELHCLFCLELNCLFCVFSIAEKEYGFIEDVEKIACVKIQMMLKYLKQGKIFGALILLKNFSKLSFLKKTYRKISLIRPLFISPPGIYVP